MSKPAGVGLVTYTLLALLTTAGLFYVDIMAALVAGLRDAAGFTAQQAGLVAAANVYGAALGGLIAVFTVKHLPWRRTAMVLLLILIALDLACIRIAAPTALVAVRVVHGLAGGLLVGTGYSLIARTDLPERAFGALFFLQFGLGGVGVAIIPSLVPVFGVRALFVTLAAFSAVTLATLPLLPEFPARRISNSAGAGPVEPRYSRAALGASLGAVFLFQTANMSFVAFAIDVGRQFGHTTRFVSGSLGISQWVALLGPLAVMLLGERFGRLRPLIIAITANALAKAAFVHGDSAAVFLGAGMLTALSIAFAMPYLLSVCAAFDPSGRTATLGGFFSKLGLATGPAVGAFILQSRGAQALVLFAAATTVASALVCGIATRYLERKQESG